MPNGDDLVRLSAGDLALLLAPRIGGAVAAFTKGGRHLLRPTPAKVLEQGLVRKMSAFPLVPYSNRIANGRFEFDGVVHRLMRNDDDRPHALHGNGWQLPWAVADRTSFSCTLVLDHEPSGPGPGGNAGWPFAFRATQSFDLSEQSLRLSLGLENRDGRRMPAGLGWHPFFPSRPHTSVAFQATGLWENAPDMLPARHQPVPDEWMDTAGRPINTIIPNNCFTGWAGSADIRQGDGQPALTLTADPIFSKVIVYRPSAGMFFAFEPVTHMPDAINRQASVADHGLQVLLPGESLVGSVSLSPRP